MSLIHAKILTPIITYGRAETRKDLESILALQQLNLPSVLNEDEILEQGFVSVEHSLLLLRLLNAPDAHIIAKDNHELVGYTLVMNSNHRKAIPMLVPMFEKIDQLKLKGRSLNNNYVVMGQVCIAKAYRGIGVFSGLYTHMIKVLSHKFQFLITEVSTKNQRSIRAHEKFGFTSLLIYTDADGVEWSILILDMDSH